MYARVTKFEGGNADAIRETMARIRADADSGPPEGVPASGFLLLSDPDGGRAIAISLFATEDDRRKGDETLNAMSPPGEGLGTRGGVEMYDVAVDVRT